MYNTFMKNKHKEIDFIGKKAFKNTLMKNKHKEN